MKVGKQKRGAYRREECSFIGVWVPASWLHHIDTAVRASDIDRSKFLRRALSEKINKEAA